jgi:hypothetical protein
MNKEELNKKIEEHGKKLNIIFNTDHNPIELCKKLFRLENKAHKMAERYCNGETTEEQAQTEEYKIITTLGDILFKNSIPDVPIFINMDPRGYALKIDDGYVRDNNIDIPRDWGGYGLIAPDLREA